MNVNSGMVMRGQLTSREPKISGRGLSLDFPIYDMTSRSLKQMFMLRPIATSSKSIFQTAASIWVLIKANSRHAARARIR
jgi:hypothetical protein